MESIKPTLELWLQNMSLSDYWVENLSTFIIVVALFLVAVLINYITKKIILAVIVKIIERSKTNWDNIMLKRKVFSRLSQVVPLIFIFIGIPHLFESTPGFIVFIQKSLYIYIIFWSTLIIDALLKSLNEIYENYDSSNERPIKGYIQVVQIIIYLMTFLLMLAVVLNKPIGYVLAGLGTLTAVFMLVFKDSLLGLTAGIQMSINKMVRIGDWISIPSQNADGTVIEITLNTVKVQNWDNTITTVPAYSLVSGSFQNWRGMEESGGRRIKRSILIDQTSIKFCDDAMLERFQKIDRLKEYVNSALKEIKEYNENNITNQDMPINGRRLTNIGTFRQYIREYLLHHPEVNKELTVMVRQLQPTEKGIPLELYFFSKEKRWAFYEGIQSDIFDHLLSAIHQFELRVFQEPTGYDMQGMAKFSNKRE